MSLSVCSWALIFWIQLHSGGAPRKNFRFRTALPSTITTDGEPQIDTPECEDTARRIGEVPSDVWAGIPRGRQPLVHEPAAVYVQGRSGQVGRLGRGQEDDD